MRGDHLLQRAARRRPSRIRLSIAGATGRPVSPALCRVVGRWLSSPSADPLGGRSGRPLSNTDWSSPEECASTNGRGLQARLVRVAAQRQRQLGQLLADPGAAARLGEDRTALGGVPGRRPTTSGRSAGRRRRSAAAASRTARRAARSAARPSRAATASSASSAGRVHVLEVPGGRARPRPSAYGPGTWRSAPACRSAGRAAAAAPSRCPGSVDVSSWLAKPYSSPAARTRRVAKASPSAGREVGEDRGRGLGGRVGEVGGTAVRPATSGCASSAGPAPRAAASAARTSGSSSSRGHGRRGTTTPEAVPCLPSTVAMTVSVRPAGDAVGGQRVARPAQVGASTPRRR